MHNENFICDKKPKKKYDAKYRENNLFRNTALWKKKRVEIKERDLYLCKVCKSGYYNKPIKYNNDNLDVHHIIALENNDDLKLDNNNLITLCKYHHRLSDIGIIPKYVLYSLINERRFDNMLNIVYGSPCSRKDYLCEKA